MGKTSNFLKEKKEELSISTGEFARGIKISDRGMINLLEGKSLPTDKTIRYITDFLQCDRKVFRELVKYDKENKNNNGFTLKTGYVREISIMESDNVSIVELEDLGTGELYDFPMCREFLDRAGINSLIIIPDDNLEKERLFKDWIAGISKETSVLPGEVALIDNGEGKHLEKITFPINGKKIIGKVVWTGKFIKKL